MQSKTYSLIESLTNVAVGYLVALGGQLLIFPLFGIAVKIGDNILIGVLFTVLSIIRSYALRRMFNKINPKVKEECFTMRIGKDALKWIIEDEKGGEAVRNMIIEFARHNNVK